MIIAATDHRS